MKPLERERVMSVVRGMGLASNLGLTVGVTVFLGVLLGNYLDEKVGGKGILFSIIVILSVIVGLYGAIRAVRKSLEKKP
ncbi:MAG TPA: AtpZ/AtpI family protein [Candidatus Hydrogenedentes bacterium]|jgi:membrane protein DedA with SNARE-associated domain|nr:MAG: putative F0F1-ATPase [Candidatus Hydrogenedentes bacterium ADurb.Bin179]HOC70639.1 AtpZ/AtpI family protein [Candidatus Hydrogenedentota bacterium]